MNSGCSCKTEGCLSNYLNTVLFEFSYILLNINMLYTYSHIFIQPYLFQYLFVLYLFYCALIIGKLKSSGSKAKFFKENCIIHVDPLGFCFFHFSINTILVYNKCWERNQFNGSLCRLIENDSKVQVSVNQQLGFFNIDKIKFLFPYDPKLNNFSFRKKKPIKPPTMELYQ